MFFCSKCGFQQTVPTRTCSVCGSLLGTSQSEMSSSTLARWETRTWSLFVELWKICRYIILSPKRFFSEISSRSTVKSAILFFFLLTLVTLPVTLLYQDYSLLGNRSAVALQILSQPVLTIFGGIAGTFIGSGILHLLFVVTGVRKVSYKETAMVVFYANAPLLFLLVPIPYVPVIVAGIWAMVLQIIGTAVIHSVSVRKMAVIQIVPCLLLLLLAAICIAVLFAIAAATGISLVETFGVQDILDLIR